MGIGPVVSVPCYFTSSSSAPTNDGGGNDDDISSRKESAQSPTRLAAAQLNSPSLLGWPPVAALLGFTIRPSRLMRALTGQGYSS